MPIVTVFSSDFRRSVEVVCMARMRPASADAAHP